MTAINLQTQIPNAITTLEQLHAWSGLALATLNPDIAILESDVRAEYVAQDGIFTAADQSIRLLLRTSIELDPSFRFDNTKKLWMHAKEFKPVLIPTSFTQN